MSSSEANLFKNDYRIIRTLSEGTLGTTYEAEDMIRARTVALKVMLNSQTASSEEIERFSQEARLLSKLNSPNLGKLVDPLDTSTHPYSFAVDILEGEPLSQWIAKKTTFSIQNILDIIKQLLSALRAIHSLNYVHADVRPENIFLHNVSENVYVLKLIHLSQAVDISNQNFTAKPLRYAHTSRAPLYLSPEQAAGARLLDLRSDLYSVGIILFELLTGHPPFESNSMVEILNKHMVALAPHLPDLSQKFIGFSEFRKLDIILQKLLAKKARSRYASAEDAIESLDKLTRSVPPPAPAQPIVINHYHSVTPPPLPPRSIPQAPALEIPNKSATPPRLSMHSAVRDSGGGFPISFRPTSGVTGQILQPEEFSRLAQSSVDSKNTQQIRSTTGDTATFMPPVPPPLKPSNTLNAHITLSPSLPSTLPNERRSIRPPSLPITSTASNFAKAEEFTHLPEDHEPNTSVNPLVVSLGNSDSHAILREIEPDPILIDPSLSNKHHEFSDPNEQNYAIDDNIDQETASTIKTHLPNIIEGEELEAFVSNIQRTVDELHTMPIQADDILSEESSEIHTPTNFSQVELHSSNLPTTIPMHTSVVMPSIPARAIETQEAFPIVTLEKAKAHIQANRRFIALLAVIVFFIIILIVTIVSLTSKKSSSHSNAELLAQTQNSASATQQELLPQELFDEIERKTKEAQLFERIDEYHEAAQAYSELLKLHVRAEAFRDNSDIAKIKDIQDKVTLLEKKAAEENTKQYYSNVLFKIQHNSTQGLMFSICEANSDNCVRKGTSFPSQNEIIKLKKVPYIVQISGDNIEPFTQEIHIQRQNESFTLSPTFKKPAPETLDTEPSNNNTDSTKKSANSRKRKSSSRNRSSGTRRRI